MKTAIIASAFVLAGCTAWQQPGRGRADFERDLYECQREAAPVQDTARAAFMRDQCLRYRGWR